MCKHHAILAADRWHKVCCNFPSGCCLAHVSVSHSKNDKILFFPFSSSPLCRFATNWQTESFFFFLKKNTSSSSSSSSFPLAQSEWEMSQPISCGIQREQSHYWLMRRRGIKAFILITVMSVCNRAACTCFTLLPNIILIFYFFSGSDGGMDSHSKRGKLICWFRFI